MSALSRPRKNAAPPDLAAIARRALAALRLRRGACVIAGVSGGADSTALACALAEAAAGEGWRLQLAHLHHGLRGAAADRDLEFVRSLARALGARCSAGRADVRAAARRRALSIEMAAREARRRFFAALARRWNAAAVVLAHTADDQAETVLLRLARGAAARGLGGMSEISDLDGIPLARPFLGVFRRDIEAWLRARGQPWRDDASNRDLKHLRNRVRRRVLPAIERELNPRAKEALIRAARALRDDEALLSKHAAGLLRRAAARGGGLRAEPLRRAAAPLRRRALRDWLRTSAADCAEPDEGLIQRVESAVRDEGRVVEVRRGWRATVRDGALILYRDRARRRRAPAAHPVPQPLSGRAELPWADAVGEARRDRGFRTERPAGAGRLPAVAWISLDKARREPLVWRAWRPGDRIRPLGMTGSRKLQDIFTDARLPPAERRRLPVLASGRDIVWVPGYRIARDWAAPSPRAPTVRLRLRRVTAAA